MRRHVTILLAAALAGLSGAAPAETPAQGDLVLMTAKASSDPNLTELLQRISRGAQGEQKRMMVRQMLEPFPGARNGSFSKPLHYGIANSVMMSQQRGQMMGQILVSDLNNDGQITKQEVRDTLEFVPQLGAAEAFFTSDANDDGVLQPDEIRAAVEAQLESRNGLGFRDRTSGLRLFDFDDDGYLTPEEFARAMTALGL